MAGRVVRVARIGVIEKRRDSRRELAVEFNEEDLRFFLPGEGLWRLFFFLTALLDRGAELAGIFAIESFGDGFDYGQIILDIVPKHLAPCNGLQNHPMPTTQ